MRYLLLSAAFLGLAACAGGPTGPDAARRFDSFEVIETSDFTGYERVFVAAPVAGEEIQERIGGRTLRSAGRNLRPLTQDEVDDQLSDFGEVLRRRLGQTAELADEEGPGILTIMTTVTELDANRPTMAELSQNPSLSFQSISIGDAAARYELSEDGRLLAVLEDSDLALNLATQPRPVGMWDTARQFYRASADRLAALLSD